MSIAEIPNRQWKFIIVDEEGNVTGTDDMAVADEHNNTSIVIVTSTCQVLETFNADPIGRNIPEQTLYQF